MPNDPITPYERRLLMQLARGRSPKEIAQHVKRTRVAVYGALNRIMNSFMNAYSARRAR